MGSKNFNPIVDQGTLSYNPIGTIPSILPLINSPIANELPKPSQPIKPPQNFPQ